MVITRKHILKKKDQWLAYAIFHRRVFSSSLNGSLNMFLNGTLEVVYRLFQMGYSFRSISTSALATDDTRFDFNK